MIHIKHFAQTEFRRSEAALGIFAWTFRLAGSPRSTSVSTPVLIAARHHQVTSRLLSGEKSRLRSSTDTESP